MFRNSLATLLQWVFLGSWIFCGTAQADERFTIHEWGTFTVLQDESGNPIPGVNVNEEPLPHFVHRLANGLAPDSQRVPLSPFIRAYSKGLPPSYPAAIMRMETPIIYIYPPQTANIPRIDVRVQFRGGWISEWYPDAEVVAPGFEQSKTASDSLTLSTTGSILWKNVTLGTDKPLPATEQHVWLAPRQVAAPRLETEQGDVENYLFYRGVANLESPLRVSRNAERGQLTVSMNDSVNGSADKLAFRSIWLVDSRADGAVAFREVDPSRTDASPGVVAAVTAEFSDGSYSKRNLDALRSSMKKVLIAEGLWKDEADAMLKTWELSYFKSPGLRLFFSLPRAWTDHVLPMEVSQPADIERVMIGRIELVTPEQRNLLERIVAGPVSSPTWFWERLHAFPKDQQADILEKLKAGQKKLADYQFEVPEDYEAFVRLGRFREALVKDHLKRTESSNLESFVQAYF